MHEDFFFLEAPRLAFMFAFHLSAVVIMIVLQADVKRLRPLMDIGRQPY